MRPCTIAKGLPTSSMFILLSNQIIRSVFHKEKPKVPVAEKAESVSDQPLQEAWQGSAATRKEVV